MQHSLVKIPSSDFEKNADWFVKTGYFCMITAYKIAAFSAWIKIYQTAVLRTLLVARGSKFVSSLFQKFDAYKVAASDTTVLRYNYLEAIEERLIVIESDPHQSYRLRRILQTMKSSSRFSINFTCLFISSAGRTSHTRANTNLSFRK
jgi:hypothetical protein